MFALLNQSINMKHFIISVNCIFVFMLGAFKLQAQDVEINSKDLVYKIDTYLSESVDNGYAASVLVAAQGNIILSKGYGWSDRDKNLVNTPSTVFNIGSVTKQFTAAAILKLVEQGKLNTDDKISRFFNKAPEDKKDITIHQLLTHTSGVSRRTGGHRYDEASKEKFLNEFFESELVSKPGTTHQYANANYIMLSAIIEAVSHQNYADFLREHFWQPLHMDHTGYKTVNFSREKLAHGYYFDLTEEKWKDWGTTQDHLPSSNDHWYSIGKGDIYSTVEDLYIWHNALSDDIVLSADSRQKQEFPSVAENDAKTSFYGYGWAVHNSDRKTKIVSHNGSNGIYFADFVRFVHEDVVVIVLSNVMLNWESEGVAHEIGKMIFDNNYNAKPVSKNAYQLVYEFMGTNAPDQVEKLPGYLDSNSRYMFNDKSVFNRIGYKRIAKEKSPGWGLELLKLNVQLYPDDGNLWDSLGEAYFVYDQKGMAQESFEKALELQPETNCYWCENSTQFLSKLAQKK